jgi:glutamate-1-semialdehyde 2,1-aminomutase
VGQHYDDLMERASLLPVLRTGAADTVVARKAMGPKVYDLDNIGYIDYLGGGGSSVVGFANQFVLDAVKKVLDFGVPVGFHVPQEVDLAETLTQFLPWVGTWWFCRNQDEAMREVLSWARRSTGKDEILTLAGGARLRIGASLGQEGYDVAIREIASWNAERIVSEIRERAAKTAAVVIEPLMTRFGLIPLEVETVTAIADACREVGSQLIFDERVSGFRLARGGGAAWTGVTPDIAVYGSALGGGFPIGAVGFASERADTDPGGDDILATPHSVSLAAAEAVLSILKNNTTYDRLEERAAQLADGILNLADRFQRAIVVNRVGSVFALYVGVSKVASGTAARRADSDAYRRLVSGLREEGVLLPPDRSGTGFVSSAHGAKDIEETLNAFEQVLLRFHKEDLP